MEKFQKVVKWVAASMAALTFVMGGVRINNKPLSDPTTHDSRSTFEVSIGTKDAEAGAYNPATHPYAPQRSGESMLMKNLQKAQKEANTRSNAASNEKGATERVNKTSYAVGPGASDYIAATQSINDGLACDASVELKGTTPEHLVYNDSLLCNAEKNSISDAAHKRATSDATSIIKEMASGKLRDAFSASIKAKNDHMMKAGLKDELKNEGNDLVHTWSNDDATLVKEIKDQFKKSEVEVKASLEKQASQDHHSLQSIKAENKAEEGALAAKVSVGVGAYAGLVMAGTLLARKKDGPKIS